MNRPLTLSEKIGLLVRRLGFANTPLRDWRKVPWSPNQPAGCSKLSREEICGICTERFGITRPPMWLACCHVFHEGCIQRWWADHNSCPMCRQEYQAMMREETEEKSQKTDRRKAKTQKIDVVVSRPRLSRT